MSQETIRPPAKAFWMGLPAKAVVIAVFPGERPQYQFFPTEHRAREVATTMDPEAVEYKDLETLLEDVQRRAGETAVAMYIEAQKKDRKENVRVRV